MSIGRQSRLDRKSVRLLKKELKTLWMAKNEEGGWAFNGKQIAKMLGFGVPGGPFETLSPENVYHYRQYFGFKKRSNKITHPHRYKHGKQDEPIDLSDWIKRIDTIPKFGFNSKRRRTFNEFVFWTGLRKGELLIMTPSDIVIDGERMIINAFRLKKGDVSREEATYPLELRLGWLFVDEIYDWVNRFDENERIYDIHPWTAWNYVKSIYPEGYPHYMRLNRITAMCSDPRFSIAEIRAWTGLHIVTINEYISKSGRFATTAAQKMTDIMAEDIEKAMKTIER